MSKRKSTGDVLALKDEDNEQPIPTAWRPVFREIVRVLVQGDYRLSVGIPGVAPVSAKSAKQIQEYIDDYGETLVELPEKTWASSVCVWMGNGWDILIDLWTKKEGRSDLVLSARVKQTKAGLIVHVEMVYVP